MAVEVEPAGIHPLLLELGGASSPPTAVEAKPAGIHPLLVEVAAPAALLMVVEVGEAEAAPAALLLAGEVLETEAAPAALLLAVESAEAEAAHAALLLAVEVPVADPEPMQEDTLSISASEDLDAQELIYLNQDMESALIR
ncbi:UNVERIFIED_CONTAM: hypothetical protein FKN15_007156 [Acipenser sinensis]